MSDIAIRVENLSKLYRIGAQQERHDTLRDALVAGLRRNGKASETSEFYALRDVSFEVKRGEVVGVIGRNGAGKSTLLKILSRITEPTWGRVEIHGRVASLLEVGTGFHPELTGRENIFLNGAILGMGRSEIERKFDEIVAFSEIEKFLDTPVKRYSSGMYVRLAFAVAAHLEPEILLVDEVLAVGDAAFQKKCLGKMGDVAKEGRTVLFVSHNMAAVQGLCSRGILLQNGSVYLDDRTQKTIDAYLSMIEFNASRDVAQRIDRHGKGHVRLTDIEIRGSDPENPSVLQTGRPVDFVFRYSGDVPRIACVFTIYNHTGHSVISFDSRQDSQDDAHDIHRRAVLTCHIDELLLLPGHYRLNVALFEGSVTQDHIEGAATFDVETGMIQGRQAIQTGWTSIFHKHNWTISD